MSEVVDVRSAARAMREFHVAASRESADADRLRERMEATLYSLNAWELASARIEPGSDRWQDGHEPTASRGGPMSEDARWGWHFLPKLLLLERPSNPFAGFLEAPEFIISLIQHHSSPIGEAAEAWEDEVLRAVESCLVAIQPDLHFRTADVNLPPIPPSPSGWDDLDD
ncbi:hypothetical protein [Aeromicrobium stalagmiti]|uniref:hypothetical protein n=1 Tax=Aeromicrobium stalagmiti TaxID=2738988 RepID=UPI001568B7C7|nr:hypothetical protein [Aeromicrobium stalagmiti]NRQ50413.1 hypothetical protein [Aeromicrobium stalagmiti]